MESEIFLILIPKGNALPVLWLQSDASAALFRTARLSSDAFLAGSFQQSSRNSFIYHLFDQFTLNIPQRNTNKSGVCPERVYFYLLCVSLDVRVDT